MDKNLEGEFILNPKKSEEMGEGQSVKKHTSTHKSHRHNSTHFFSSFVDHPEGVTFANQEEGEEVALLLRRHFITNVPWIAFSIFLAILPLALPFIASTFPFPTFSSSTISLMFAFYYLFVFGFVLLNFALWYFHVGLVTTLRLLDIDLAGILYRQITVTKHENVEDVTHSQVGFVSSLFNYGHVHVQTAGTEINIEYDRIPRPAKAAEIISDLSKPV